MKTEWDYTDVADAFLKRPGYANDAIDEFIDRSGIVSGDMVCDIGAGTGILTVELARRGLEVTAVEPNQRMAAHGIRETETFSHVQWVESVAENTLLPSDNYHLVTFGSSFNVTDRCQALRESARILRPNGWLVCLFNHRDLKDPIQREIQSIIEATIPDFSHGNRREDQIGVIDASGDFRHARAFERTVVHQVRREDFMDAWASHCTLKRQAGENFSEIITGISEWLCGAQIEMIDVPYRTRVFIAQLHR